jgi:5-methylcytosine-specific restriction endonuclease McrBC GTP-binding regulatory subunit McrB
MDPFTKLEGLDEKERCSERMLLVLLDEMNLARTEYYFSEFLSKLELRRLAGSSASIERRQDAQIYLDTVPGRKAISFWVDRNVLFAGTMNEDESTQTLSDKVIDRANVLRFGRPARLNADDQNHDPLLPPAPGYLTAAIWKRWCRGITTGNWTQKALGWINSLNDALVKIGRPFGHRVEKSILAYISNYPGIEDDGNLLREAFSDQIEQKILPKLRGLDNFESANMTVFQEIAKVIEETEDDVLLKAFHSASASSNTGMFMWYGVTREE